MNQDTFEFVIYILHACANKWGLLPSATYKKLKSVDCINDLLVPFYDSMHTQGTQYIVHEVEEYLTARGQAI